MKRHKAMTASMTLAGSALVIVLVLVAGISGRGLPVALAHPVTVDGALDDWITTFPTPPENNGHVMRNVAYEGEFIWTDAGGDNRTVGTDPDSNYDLTELRVTADENDLYFLLQFEDLTDTNLPYVAIAVDTTRDGAGNTAFGDSAGVSTAAAAAWERQIVANNNRTGYFDGSFTFNVAGSNAIDVDNDVVEISMPLSDLGIDLDGGAVVRFTAFVGEHDGSGGVTVYGSHAALDAVTDAASAWPSGTVIDSFFDVYFELDGDPTSPLQISEVFYNPVGSTISDELSNEYIELYNPAQYRAYLDGMLLGDEPTNAPNANFREANFQFPGTSGTGTTYVVEPGAYVVVAIDAVTYDDDPSDGTLGYAFPDHHWADWELFQGVDNEYDNPAVPNLALVYGLTGNVVQMAIGNPGDGVMLADGTGNIDASPPLSYTIVDGMNYGNWEGSFPFPFDITPADTSLLDGDTPGSGPTVTFEGLSLQRDPTRANPDTNTSSTDFGEGAPTPGFAKGLIDHAIYKLGPTEVVAGQSYEYYLYYQIAGQQATLAVITDVLPSDLLFIDYTAKWPVTVDTSAAPTIVWDLGNVAPSTIGKITVTVQVDPMASGGTVSQIAYIDSQSTFAEGITNNDSDDLDITVRAPALAITKTVEVVSPVQLGDPVTYTIAVANRGDADAVGVHITDTLPAGVTGGDLDQTLTINAGEQAEFTIPATVVNDPAYYGATIVNIAYYDHASGSGSDDASFVVAAPDLTIAKTVETPHDPVHPGDTVTYTVVVRNAGDANALGVHVTDVLPAGVTGTGLDETVTVSANGGQQQFTYNATVSTDAAFYGVTVVNTAEYDHSTGSGSDTASFTIAAPDLVVEKTVETAQARAQLGDVVTYTVTIANNSPATATGVVMTDVLPLGVTFGGWIDQGAAMPGTPSDTITWGPNDVGPSGSFSFTATVTTDEAFYGARITNTVKYDSANAGSGSSDAAFTIVAAGADLSGSTKVSSAAGQQVMPGDRVTYTITLLNGGAMAASARITDVLGSYYAIADAGDLTASSPRTLTWSGSVPGGGQVVLQFVAQVAGLTDLPMGTTTLSNAFSVDDGVNPVFTVEDASPPQVEVKAIYLPLVLRNN